MRRYAKSFLCLMLAFIMAFQVTVDPTSALASEPSSSEETTTTTQYSPTPTQRDTENRVTEVEAQRSSVIKFLVNLIRKLIPKTKIDANDLKKIGVPGSSSSIRIVKGNAGDAYDLFMDVVDPETIQEIPGKGFYGRTPKGVYVSFRAVSSNKGQGNGEPTISLSDIGNLTKIKFED